MSGQTPVANDADALRRDIQQAYQRLRVRGELTGSVRGISIDEAMELHLHPGMGLASAERLLREAGFTIAPLSAKVSATDPVYATADTILPNAAAGVRNEVVVLLTPRGLGVDAEVGAVEARIVVTTL